MKSKQIFTIVSGSALASGMAHGAVVYSGLVDNTLAYNAGTNVFFDLNQDGTNDFDLGFGNNNVQKPYIAGSPGSLPGSAPLAQLASDGSYGLPVTAFGTVIDSNYLSVCIKNAYLKQENDDGSATTVGEWGVDSITEGYVGLEMWDGSGNTNYGWVRLIYNATAENLTLVDYAYETTAFVPIVAGATNELGKPDIYVEPQSQTNGVGANVQFSVTELANPPPTFQWEVGPTNGLGPYTPLSDGGAISGSTNAILTINGATSTNQGDYLVVISNSLGAVNSSPPAALVLVSPVVTPAAPTLFAGWTANFNVNIAGGLAPTFQWQQNGTNLADGGRITGAASSHLQIANLQATDAGSYDVLVNFGASPAPSAISVLTVLPTMQESLYDAAVLAANPVVYYRLNETGNPATSNLVAYDNASGLNGTYGSGVTNGFSGIEGPDAADGFPGFSTSNTAALFTPADTNSQITVPAWNLDTANATFTFWVNQAAIQAYSTAILWHGSNTSTYAGIDYYYNAGTGAGQPGNVDLGYTWNEEGSAAFFFWDSGIMPPVDQWSMVALVIAPPSTTLYVFDTDQTNINMFPGTNSIFPFTNAVMSLDSPETIGNNPNVAGGAEGFNGTIADMAVFNQAMTQAQVQTLYNAALGIPPNPQITIVGTNVQITWAMGSLQQATNVSGPWTINSLATSPYDIAPTGGGGSMFYRVVAP